MTHHWDEFSKALAESVPRRESLRRLGVVLASAVLGPFAVGTARASAKGRPAANGKDPCQDLLQCRNKRQQNACLAACKACGGDTRAPVRRLRQRRDCADLANDVYNCGACGYACPPPGPYETAACINGRCVNQCVDGAVRCNGTCTFLGSDPENCGACGYVCPGFAPYCNQGACSVCRPERCCAGMPASTRTRTRTTAAQCGNVCGGATPYCSGGECTDCPPGLRDLQRRSSTSCGTATTAVAAASPANHLSSATGASAKALAKTAEDSTANATGVRDAPGNQAKRHGVGTIAVTATSGWWGLHRQRRPHQPGTVSATQPEALNHLVMLAPSKSS